MNLEERGTEEGIQGASIELPDRSGEIEVNAGVVICGLKRTQREMILATWYAEAGKALAY